MSIKMKVQGRLGAVSQESFTTNEGEHVEYNKVFIQTMDENGVHSVIEANTKKDVIKLLGKLVSVTIEFKDDGKKSVSDISLLDKE